MKHENVENEICLYYGLWWGAIFAVKWFKIIPVNENDQVITILKNHKSISKMSPTIFNDYLSSINYSPLSLNNSSSSFNNSPSSFNNSSYSFNNYHPPPICLGKKSTFIYIYILCLGVCIQYVSNMYPICIQYVSNKRQTYRAKFFFFAWPR